MKRILACFTFLLFFTSLHAQTFEWRLGQATYNSTDPDGAGPATGTASFTLQMHTTGATVNNITQIATGFSYQSANAMVPTNPGCVTTSSTPANITLSPASTAAGFAYTSVFQCNTVSPAINIGGQVFDRRANGTIDNGAITIGPAWTDVFTVTMWTLGTTTPQGGYVIINSSEGGAPGEYTTYSVTDGEFNQYPANSLTYTTPLALSSATLPVQFTRFSVECTSNGTFVNWATASERNNSHFEVEKSTDGGTWTSVGRVNGNSSRNYQLTDKQGGQAFYRIKQVDQNGAVTYTGAVRSICNNSNFYVNLYPVPAKDKLTLVIGSEKAVNATVQVLDNSGRVVMSTRLTINRGANNFTLEVAHLPQGQYFLRSNTEGININQRFTINR